MADTILATQGKAMRQMREHGITLQFPSGNHYRVRVPGAAGLLKRGNLPNALVNYCVDLLYSGDPEGKKYEAFNAPSDKEERAQEILASYEAVCKEMFLEPRVVDEPQADDEISIDDLSLQDRNWAFWLAFLEVDALKAFRPQQAADVERVDEPQDVPQAAIAGA